MATQLLAPGPFARAGEALATRLRAILVAVRSPAGGGSGIAWTRDGLVLTNNHVVPGERVQVLTGDGRTLRAEVVSRDPAADLALLRVDGRFADAAETRASATVRVGELVFALGNPWGEPGVLTHGVVIARGPATVEVGVPLPDAIRADVRIAPGNSGGPLADASGRVVGINSMIAGGMAIAIPSDVAVAFAGPAGVAADTL